MLLHDCFIALPSVPNGLSQYERGKYQEPLESYENSRAMIEDNFLPNERQENGLLNTKTTNYIKLGNKVIKGSAQHLHVGINAVAVPYTWQHDYPAGEGRAEYDAIKKGQKGGVLFIMHSTNSARYKRAVAHDGTESPDYTVACKDLDKKPHTDSTLVWKGIFFAPLISKKQGQQEWHYLCPEVVKIVSQVQEIQLKPINRGQ